MTKLKYVILILFVFIASCSICENTIVEEVYSPDKLLKAIAFERTCGATTPNYIKVQILGKDEKLDESLQATIFSYTGNNYIDIKWTSNNALLIKYSKDYGKITYKCVIAGDINILYQEVDKIEELKSIGTARKLSLKDKN